MTAFGNIVRSIKQGAQTVGNYAKEHITIELVNSTLTALLPVANEPYKSYIKWLLLSGKVMIEANGTNDLKKRLAEAIDEQKSMLESEQATA